MSAFPPPDASREEVRAWQALYDGERARALCDCGHARARHTFNGGTGCAVAACPCEDFDDAPHEAPLVRNGPSLVCNACGVVRVGLGTPFCRGCLALTGAT